MLVERIFLRQPLLQVRVANVAAAPATPAARPRGGAASATDSAPVVRADASTAVTQKLIDTLLASLTQSIDELEQRRSRSLDEMRQAVVELSVAVASSIVHATIQADQFNLNELVSQAVAQADDGMALAIHLNPLDLELVLASLENRSTPWPRGVEVRLQADPKLARGSCRADGPDFGWLSTVEQRLADIRQNLLDNLGQETVDRRNSAAAQRGFGRVPDRRGTA